MVENLFMARGKRKSTEGIYGYIRRLREKRGYTQEEFAQAIGMPHRTYVDYETRSTKELKQSMLVKAVMLLKAPWEHIEQIIVNDLDEESGCRLADDFLTDKQKEMIDPFLESDEGTRALLWSVYEVSRDPLLRERIKAYLDGLTDRLDLDDLPSVAPRRRWLRRKPPP